MVRAAKSLETDRRQDSGVQVWQGRDPVQVLYYLSDHRSPVLREGLHVHAIIGTSQFGMFFHALCAELVEKLLEENITGHLAIRNLNPLEERAGFRSAQGSYTRLRRNGTNYPKGAAVLFIKAGKGHRPRADGIGIVMPRSNANATLHVVISSMPEPGTGFAAQPIGQPASCYMICGES